MSSGVGDRVQDLEDTLQKLSEFNDNLEDVANNLKKYEDKVEAHKDLGPAAKDGKHLDKMRVSLFYLFIFICIVYGFIIVIRILDYIYKILTS